MTLTQQARRTHAKAVGLLVLATLLWSIAGAVTRHLDDPNGPAITLWRSAFAGLFVVAYLVLPERRGFRGFWSAVPLTALSGVLWCAMFCCFMFALTKTSVANTLVVYSLAPLLTALLAAVILGAPVPGRTWIAIAIVSAGLLAMFAQDFDGRSMTGVWLALGVPLASALNLVVMKKAKRGIEFVPSLLIGCILSIAVTAPYVWPVRTSVHDLVLLALLGVFQLGIPCVLMVRAIPHLSAPEASLLDLLEVVFGVFWAWVAAGEVPSSATLVGGSVVLGGLVVHEFAALRAAPAL